MILADTNILTTFAKIDRLPLNLRLTTMCICAIITRRISSWVGGKFMSVTEAMKAAQFVVDAEGNQKAVVLEFTIWQDILQALTRLSELEAQPSWKQRLERLLARVWDRVDRDPISEEEISAEVERARAELYAQSRS